MSILDEPTQGAADHPTVSTAEGSNRERSRSPRGQASDAAAPTAPPDSHGQESKAEPGASEDTQQSPGAADEARLGARMLLASAGRSPVLTSKRSPGLHPRAEPDASGNRSRSVSLGKDRRRSQSRSRSRGRASRSRSPAGPPVVPDIETVQGTTVSEDSSVAQVASTVPEVARTLHVSSAAELPSDCALVLEPGAATERGVDPRGRAVDPRRVAAKLRRAATDAGSDGAEERLARTAELVCTILAERTQRYVLDDLRRELTPIVKPENLEELLDSLWQQRVSEKEKAGSNWTDGSSNSKGCQASDKDATATGTTTGNGNSRVGAVDAVAEDSFQLPKTAAFAKLKEKAEAEKRGQSAAQQRAAATTDLKYRGITAEGDAPMRRALHAGSSSVAQEAALHHPISFLPAAEVQKPTNKIVVIDPKGKTRKKSGGRSDDSSPEPTGPRFGITQPPRPREYDYPPPSWRDYPPPHQPSPPPPAPHAHFQHQPYLHPYPHPYTPAPGPPPSIPLVPAPGPPPPGPPPGAAGPSNYAPPGWRSPGPVQHPVPVASHAPAAPEPAGASEIASTPQRPSVFEVAPPSNGSSNNRPPDSPARKPSAAPTPSPSKGSLTLVLSDAGREEDRARAERQGQKKSLQESKKKMLEQLTKQLQALLGRLQDDKLDGASKEKYQDMVNKVSAQISKVSDLK
eukprot:gnl/TRDRNA2_/TRDRNA2_168244_c1_seq1.p1 gnl/TRDRNA2_/TRDRNA2_168244_c1~~gnl/TRDRNA2_/TRDRNA2_168244_c1_seq1.p1  ORF type:complete len:687 (+),score=113.37 gnl/TRDRNA2_/TRDRNA2_168244_c1_seq1:72-2132(+)